MTRQKKFKRRVRARMEETGERYTEAQAELESRRRDDGTAGIGVLGPVDRALERIAEADDVLEAARIIASVRMSPHGTEEAVVRLAREYHASHLHLRGGPGSPTLLASELLGKMWWRHAEVLTPSELTRRIREVLDRWWRGGTPEDGVVLEPRTPLKSNHPLPREEDVFGAPPSHDDPGAWDGGDVEFTVPEPAAEAKADIEGLDLEDMWDRAPDVSHVFFGGERPLDQNTAQDLARQFRRMADQAEAMGVTGSRFDFRGEALPRRRNTAVPRPKLATEKIQLGEEELDGLHGGDADELIRYAQEIQRLRAKLADHGIDPDDAPAA